MDDAEVDFDSPTAWDDHMKVIERLLPSPVDAAFTSAEYGAELARRLGATWVQVDPGRELNPVLGTAVRADPDAYWWALAPSVRASLTKRVVVLGGESTGTTTLARALAEELRTLRVEECGREHSEIPRAASRRRGGATSLTWASSARSSWCRRRHAVSHSRC